MAEDLINKIIDTPAVKKQIDELFAQLQKVVEIIQDINKTSGQINMALGLGASAKAASDAKQKIEELRLEREKLKNQEQELRNEALKAANAAAAQARTEANASAARLRQTQESIAAIKEQSAADKLARQQASQAARDAAAAAKAAALSEYGSINQLRAILNQARKDYDALGVAAREAGKGKDLLNTIKVLNEQVTQLEAATGRFQRNVGNYPQKVVGGVSNLLGVFGVGTGLYGLKQVLDLKGEISDQLGDIQRIMQITAADTDRLFESLKKLDTRTSTSGLLDIAIIAAKAGVAKGDIVEVTAAIDKLTVVLGKELGGADKVTEVLIKIANVYSKDGKVTAETITSIGNGILALANAGIATAPFITDYTNRIGGISKVANVSLKAALGLGAGFEELGQSSEVAGTATVQVLTKIAQNVPKFANIAGKSVKEFSKTLREEPQEALLQVAQGLSRGAKGFDEIATAFKDSEAKGIRVISTLGILGAKADFFREKIKLAGEALNDTSAINDQFAIKNNTLAGSFDKLVKSIQNLASDPNSTLGKFFKFVIDQSTLAIGYIDRMGDAFNRLTGSKNADQLIDPENLSKLAKGKVNLNAITGSTGPGFSEAFAQAKSVAQDNQQPFINAFAKKSIQEQGKDLSALKEAIDNAHDSYEKLVSENGKLAPVTISSSIGIEALNYRLKEYVKIVRDAQNAKPTDGDPYKRPPTEKELNKAAKLSELRDQANGDNQKFDLQNEIEHQKAIVDNDKRSLEDRLQAEKEYYKLKDQLAEIEAETQKNKIKEEIARGRAVPEQLAAVDKKLAKEQDENARENGKNLTKILLDNVSEEVRIKTNTYTKLANDISDRQDEETAALENNYAKGRISLNNYELEKIRIKNKYAIEELQNELEHQKDLLNIMQYTADPEKVEELRNKIRKIEHQIRALDLKDFDETEKKKTEIETRETKERLRLQKEHQKLVKDAIEKTIRDVKEISDAITGVFTANLDAQKTAIQDQQTALDANTQKEIEAVNASTDSAQNKADKITVINARAQAQKEELDRRQRKIDQEKARFDRFKSIGDVIANTAVNITKVFPNPVLIALAAAVGAAQLAQILAAPIPHYRYGTDDHPGGLAHVNDGGQLEVLESPTGQAYVAPKMDALINLPEHYKVHTSLADYFEASGASNYRSVVTPDGKLVELRIITDKMQKDTANQTQELLAGMARNKSVVNINYTWAGIEVNQQTVSGTIDYLNKNVRV